MSVLLSKGTDGNVTFIELAERIGAVPLAVMLLSLVLANGYVLIIGGKKKWWLHGWYVTELVQRHANDLAAALKREQEWKDFALSGRFMTTELMDILKSRRRQ